MSPRRSDCETQDAGSRRCLAGLSRSTIYRDYECAFTQGTGLPLSLHAPQMLNLVRYARGQENPFCALFAKTNQTCAACYALQQKLEEEAHLRPKTLKCFAGLCETAVPVRVGDNLIAFLQTGQVLLHRPGMTQFNRIAATLIRWGAEVDLKTLEEAYFNTRILKPQQYESLIRLLTIFAQHLGSCASQLALQSEQPEPEAVTRARSYVDQNYREVISLPAVARVANMSAN